LDDDVRQFVHGHPFVALRPPAGVDAVDGTPHTTTTRR
jgi:hypothetical protein